MTKFSDSMGKYEISSKQGGILDFTKRNYIKLGPDSIVSIRYKKKFIFRSKTFHSLEEAFNRYSPLLDSKFHIPLMEKLILFRIKHDKKLKRLLTRLTRHRIDIFYNDPHDEYWGDANNRLGEIYNNLALISKS